MECLFWLAFEQRKYDFIISVIHHVANLQWQITQNFFDQIADPDAPAQSANETIGALEGCVVEHDLKRQRRNLQEHTSSLESQSMEVANRCMSSDSQSHCDERTLSRTTSVTNKNSMASIDDDIVDGIESRCYKTYTCPHCSYERMFSC